MTPHETLIHTVTEYDRKQSTKKFHNRYALGIYFQQIETISLRTAEGEDLRKVIISSFNGRLLDNCLKALNLTPATIQEHQFK